MRWRSLMHHAPRLAPLFLLGLALAAPGCIFLPNAPSPSPSPTPCGPYGCTVPAPPTPWPSSEPDADYDEGPGPSYDAGDGGPFDPPDYDAGDAHDGGPAPEYDAGDGGPTQPPPPDPEPDCTAPPALASTPDSPADYLREAIVGRWHGVAVPPRSFIGPETYPVSFEFFSDGSYGVSCGVPGCAGLFAGVDGVGEGRHYELSDVSATGEGEFDLYVRHDRGDLTAGSVRRVNVWDQGNGLGFEFSPTWAGPGAYVVQYALRRSCAPAPVDPSAPDGG